MSGYDFSAEFVHLLCLVVKISMNLLCLVVKISMDACQVMIFLLNLCTYYVFKSVNECVSNTSILKSTSNKD